MAKGIYINEKTFKTLDQLSLEKEIATREIATGSFAGWFNILPDPDPILRKLGESVAVYKDLSADDQVSSTMIRLKNEVKSMEWHIKAADGMDDKSVEMEYSKLALQSLEDNGCKIKDIISQSLSPHFWGMAVFEITWDTKKRPWLPVKMQLKPVDWFRFDGDNNLLMQTMNNPVGLPITGPNAAGELKYMFVTLRNEPTYENPYGDKALSRCFWPVAFKRGGLRFLSLFIEKYGMPSIEIKHPPGTQGDDLDKLVQAASMMIQDSVIAIPDGNQITIHRPGEKQSGELYKMYIDMCDAMIDKAILTNTFATSQQSKGGYSSANAGSDIVSDLGKQLKDYPEEIFSALFKSVIDLNIGSKKYTKFITFEEDEPKKDFAERDKTLSESAQASGQQIKKTKQYYINNYGYNADEFEIVESTQQPPQPVTNPQPVQFKEAGTINNLDINIPDKLTQLMMEKTLAPVFKLIEENTDRKKIISGLAKIYPTMDTTEIEDIMTKLIFIADTQGRIEAQRENLN